MRLNDFINKAIAKHGDKYDYSRVNYINSKTKVCIICKEHGEFWQTPASHLYGRGCPKCALKNNYLNNTNRKTTEDFIKKAQEKHMNEDGTPKYDYSKVEYKNNGTKVCIICSKHGEFWQTPHNHLSNHGCIKCRDENNSKKFLFTKDYFISLANKKHNNFYDYFKVEYVNSWTKVCIICPIHGEFWQTPAMHLSGQGCPICNKSKLEIEISEFLETNNIEFVYQCNSKIFKWLDKLTLDFYLPKYNVVIECQGRQHFVPIEHFGGCNELEVIKERDERKLKLCNEHNIKLLYYSNLGIEYPYKVFEDKQELLNEINNNIKNS